VRRRPLLVALLAAPLAGCGAAEHAAPARPNVLLVSLDTTRADHLSVYGYARPTSPNLDALAREAVVYERAYSTTSWTLPAHASLFTGKYPSSHGVRHDPEGALVLADAIGAHEGIRARALGAGEATLAALLRDAGWRTGAVVGGPWLLRTFGLGEGFDSYDDRGIRNSSGRRARDVTESALAWLDSGPEPFFLFLNYFDPHVPYAPPARWAASFLPRGVKPDPTKAAHAEALYDAEILYMDYELGRVFAHLREAGQWDRTLVVVVADHGELLGERGLWGHENWLWEPLVHIPMLVKPAGGVRGGERRDELASLVDVAPLVLEACGLAAPADLQGGEPGARHHPVLAEVNPIDPRSYPVSWRGLWQEREKVLESSAGERHLFDLADDPGEAQDLAADDAERTDRALARLARAFAALPPPPAPDAAPPVRVDEDTVEALRRLGYLEDGRDEPAPPAD
jgi:arylsulfatase A-like enzyme